MLMYCSECQQSGKVIYVMRHNEKYWVFKGTFSGKKYHRHFWYQVLFIVNI